MTKLARSRLHFLEQAHILDGDHGLIGEGRDEFDLLVCKGFDGLSCQEQHPDRLPQAKEGNGKEGPVSDRFLQLRISVFRICQDVGNLQRLGRQQRSSNRTAALRPGFRSETEPIGREIVVRRIVEAAVSTLPGHGGHVSVTKPRRRLRERVEYSL